MFARGARRWLTAAMVVCAVAGLISSIARYNSWRSINAIREIVYDAEPSELVAAIATLRSASPSDPELAYMQAVACRRAGETSKAQQFLDEARQLGWPLRDIQRQRRLIRLQSGYVQEADSLVLELAGGGYPDHEAPEIYECIAKSYLAEMQFHDANGVLAFWLEWRPNAVQPRMIKADLLAAVQNVSGELREYEQILRIDPGHFEAHLRLGQGLMKANDLSGAREHFDACWRTRPGNHAVALELADCYARLGDVGKAEALLRNVLAGEPSERNEARALYELGQIAIARKDLEGAIKRFERALELAPDNPRLNYAYGVAMTKVGNARLGKSHLQRSEELGKQASQVTELMEQIVRQPRSADLRCEAGRLALRLNNHGQALRWLFSALRYNPTHRSSHEALAQYYTEIGRPDLAKEHLAVPLEGANPGDSASNN